MNTIPCYDVYMNSYPVFVDQDVYTKLRFVNLRLDAWGYPAFSLDCTQWTVGVFVLGKKKGYVVDHIDGNKMNCCLLNLRHATKSQNALNAGPHKDNPTGYKGVSSYGQSGKFRARLKIGNRVFAKNSFDTPEAAALQVNQWIKESGIVAPLNIIQ